MSSIIAFLKLHWATMLDVVYGVFLFNQPWLNLFIPVVPCAQSQVSYTWMLLLWYKPFIPLSLGSYIFIALDLGCDRSIYHAIANSSWSWYTFICGIVVAQSICIKFYSMHGTMHMCSLSNWGHGPQVFQGTSFLTCGGEGGDDGMEPWRLKT